MLRPMLMLLIFSCILRPENICAMKLEDLNTTYAQLAARNSTQTLEYAPHLKFVGGVTILYGGSRGSKIEPCGCRGMNLGGLDREAAMIQAIRQANPGTVVFDGGGYFRGFGDPELRLQSYYYLMAARAAGYDVLNIGYRDLTMGVDFLQRAEAEMGVQFVSANIVDAETKVPLFRTSRIVTVKRADGATVKVGVIGVTAPNANVSHSTGTVAMETSFRWTLPGLLGGSAQPTAAGGSNSAMQFVTLTATGTLTQKQYRILDEVETVKPLAERLRGECDIMVLLAFAGDQRTRQIAESVPLFDVAIAGDFRRRVPPMEIGNWNTLVTGIDIDGKYLGQAEVQMDGAGQVTGKAAELIPILVSYVTRADITRYIDAFNRDKKNLPPPPQLAAGDGFAGARKCASCHAPESAQWKSTRHFTAMRSLVKEQMQDSPDCLKCHTVGYRMPGGFTDLKVTLELAGVQCESCHGPGRKHVEERRKPATNSSSKQTTASFTRMNRNFDTALCVQCHDEQNDPDFNFEVDLKKVMHNANTTTGSASGS